MTSNQRHQEHLSSYLKSRKGSPSNRGSPAGRVLSSTCKSPSCKSENKKTQEGTSSRSQDPKHSYAARYTERTPYKLKSGSSNNIERLPDELLIKILKFLSPSQLLVCAQVCRRWSEVTQDCALWQDIFPRLPQDVRKLIAFEETKAEGFDWKKEIIKRCIKARNNKILCSKKKLHIKSYTGLPSDTDSQLKLLSIKWKLCFTDTNGRNHWVSADESCYFASSVSVRWLSLDLPPLSQLKSMKIFACVPVFFNRGWKPHINSATTRSLVLSYDLRSTGGMLTREKAIAEDDMITAHTLPQGILLACWKAAWKDGGELAFVTACVHHHNIVKRVLLGSAAQIYPVPPHKPIYDDIDRQYGLHGYSATVEIRSQKSTCWGRQYRELYHSGLTVDSVVFGSFVTEHGMFSKRVSLPWKTELFRGILQNACILDLTVLDERKKPMWCVSSPVKVQSNVRADVDLSTDGERHFIEYNDEKGAVHIDLVWIAAEEQTLVSNTEFRIHKTFVNNWFGTSH